jgi:hypothetical protein
MEQQNYLDETETKKLPGAINVLTILTFIGSGLGVLGGIWNCIKAQDNYEKIQKLMNSDELEKMPAFARSMINQDALEVARKSFENRIPILMASLICLAFCIYGAMQMRKLKDAGFWLYAVGEALPFAITYLFIGTAAYTMFMWIAIAISLLFIALYASQRKYLNKQ